MCVCVCVCVRVCVCVCKQCIYMCVYAMYLAHCLVHHDRIGVLHRLAHDLAVLVLDDEHLLGLGHPRDLNNKMNYLVKCRRALAETIMVIITKSAISTSSGLAILETWVGSVGFRGLARAPQTCVRERVREREQKPIAIP